VNVKARRCLLFVPGSRPERFEKALGAGADMVCIDLEDAVLPDHKAAARDAVIEYLGTREDATVELVVRVNGVNTDVGEQDLETFAEVTRKPDAIMLPKTETTADIQKAQRILDDQALIALIESPRGLLNAEAISTASDRLSALMFGGADYAAELRAEMVWEPLFYARVRVPVRSA
jgi:citrate lyase subunit beta/citryl-CoA lyase/(S)-citramalyl-CoA lyase